MNPSKVAHLESASPFNRNVRYNRTQGRTIDSEPTEQRKGSSITRMLARMPTQLFAGCAAAPDTMTNDATQQTLCD